MSLITSTELKALRDIGNKIDTDKADEAIQLAQETDLYNLLGDFYFDVVANAAGVGNWALLMDGSTFTVDGEDFIHRGIKALLADLAYARYSKKINANFSPFGMTVKSTPDSTPVPEETQKQVVIDAKRDAGVKLKLIIAFIETDTVLFSRYCSGSKPNIVHDKQNWSII
jgi:hypothetical protein